MIYSAARARPAGGEVLLDLNRVSVSYGQTPALKGISLQIREGEKVALVGPSGAGKTTLLHKFYQLRPKDAAFIHQHFALVPQLSAFHNIYIGQLDNKPLLYNLLNLIRPQKAELKRIGPIVEELGLGDKLFERVGALSGGQQQRVAVGRAMYRAGSMLLADEPVASIDVHQGEAIIRMIMNAKPTVVCSLHSVDFALRFAQRIIGLRLGRMLFDLPSGQVTRTLLEELYRPC